MNGVYVSVHTPNIKLARVGNSSHLSLVIHPPCSSPPCKQREKEPSHSPRSPPVTTSISTIIGVLPINNLTPTYPFRPPPSPPHPRYFAFFMYPHLRQGEDYKHRRAVTKKTKIHPSIHPSHAVEGALALSLKDVLLTPPCRTCKNILVYPTQIPINFCPQTRGCISCSKTPGREERE